MPFEVAQREGKAVVDADQRRHVLAEPFHQPFRDALSGPVFARARRWKNFHRRGIAIGHIDAQPLEASGWRCRAGVVDAYDAGEGGHRAISRNLRPPLRDGPRAGSAWPLRTLRKVRCSTTAFLPLRR